MANHSSNQAVTASAHPACPLHPCADPVRRVSLTRAPPPNKPSRPVWRSGLSRFLFPGLSRVCVYLPHLCPNAISPGPDLPLLSRNTQALSVLHDTNTDSAASALRLGLKETDITIDDFGSRSDIVFPLITQQTRSWTRSAHRFGTNTRHRTPSSRPAVISAPVPPILIAIWLLLLRAARGDK